MSLEKSKIVTFCFGNQSVKMTHFDLRKSHKAICGFYTYFTSSKMRYSASICSMDKKKNHR